MALELLLAMLVLSGLATALIVFGAPLGDAPGDNLPFGGAFLDAPRWVWVSPRRRAPPASGC